MHRGNTQNARLYCHFKGGYRVLSVSPSLRWEEGRGPNRKLVMVATTRKVEMIAEITSIIILLAIGGTRVPTSITLSIFAWSVYSCCLHCSPRVVASLPTSAPIPSRLS